MVSLLLNQVFTSFKLMCDVSRFLGFLWLIVIWFLVIKLVMLLLFVMILVVVMFVVMVVI